MVPLTTVQQPFEEMGRLAAETVIDAAGAGKMPDDGITELPASVLTRASVKQAETGRGTRSEI